MPRSDRVHRAKTPEPAPQSTSGSFEPSASRGSGGRCEQRKGRRSTQKAVENEGVEEPEILNEGEGRSARASRAVAGASQMRKSRAREREAAARAEKRAERRGERKALRRERERQGDTQQLERRNRYEQSTGIHQPLTTEDNLLHDRTRVAQIARFRRESIAREQVRNATEVGLYLGVDETARGNDNSRSRARQGGSDDEKPWKSPDDMEDLALIASPSALWNSLSLPARAAAAVIGFLIMYYLLFAKHGRYEVVDTIVQGSAHVVTDETRSQDGNTTESNTSVALVRVPLTRPPPIWHREVLGMLDAKRKQDSGEAESKPGQSKVPINYALEAAKAAQKEEMEKDAIAKTNPPSVATTTTAAVTQSQEKETTTAPASSDSKKKSKKSSKKRPMRVVQTAPPITTASTSSEVAPVVTNDAANATTPDSSAALNQDSSANPETSDTVISTSTQSQNETSEAAAKTAPSPSVSRNSTEVQAETGIAKASDADGRNSTEQQMASTSGPGELVEGKNSSSNGVSSEGETLSNSTMAGEQPAFANLNPQGVPEGEIELLHWNYEGVLDQGTSSQYFALAGHDHVASFKPLCINPETQKVITKEEPRLCGGYNRTAGWMIQYCSTVQESFDKESNLEKDSSIDPKVWLDEQEQKQNVHWVEGLTILQLYEKNCGNIAHFAGRATMLQHVMENINAYAAPPHQIENILIVPTFHIMKRFLYPHNYAFWHKNFLRAIIAPSTYTIGTLGNFLYRAGKEAFNGVPRVQLLHNFTMSGSNMPEGTVVCFRQAIVPGYFKDRYFADDREYPSEKPSFQSKLPETPKMPRDALRMRERVSALLHKSTTFPGLTKRVIYLDRDGTRRAIPSEQKEKLFEMLTAAAKKRLFKFEVISFNDKNFQEQVDLVEKAGIAIGVHGANLVNTMFMVRLLRKKLIVPSDTHMCPVY